MPTSLTYLSTATVPFDDVSLRELLAVSRRNNHAAGLSGMLIFAGGHFVQTLEGERAAVEEAFDRIAADPRHRDVLVALREDVEECAFADWSMGFEQVEIAPGREVPGLNDFLAHVPGDADPASRLGRAGVFHRVFRDNMR